MSEDRDSRRGALSVAGVGHEYSGVVVLRDISLELAAGEVHALVGENGSGKSTLIRILGGALRPRRGTVLVDGRPVTFSSPEQARASGVGVVHQDDHLFGDLTVAECVYGVNKPLPRRRFTRLVDRARVDREVEETLGLLGVDIAPRRLVRSLNATQRKFVEIARAMIVRPRFLILDEATASFEPRAARAVLEVMDRLRAQGVGLCFVSHRLDEVVRIADRVSALRDGRLVGRLTRDEADEDRLAALIVGGAQPPAQAPRTPAGPATLLRVENLRLLPDRPPTSIDVRAGEILGVAGLLGSGAATFVRMIGGAEPLRGRASTGGDPVTIASPRDARRLGIGFVPEDRKGAGLVPGLSVAVNMSLAALDTVTTRGVLRRRRMRAQAESYRRRLSIKTASVDAPVQTLSGGNQQKVMIAKWLASDVRVLAIEEPTHGVDVGAKAQIHDLLRAFTADGRAIVLASTDVHEVLELCDRIAVFRHGELTDVLSPGELSTAALTARGAKAPDDVLGDLLVAGAAGGDAR